MNFRIITNIKIILLFLLLSYSGNILAQNPVRDTTFRHTGVVRTPIGINNEDATSVIVQSDDKIVAGGTQTDNPTFGPQNFALVRYELNGDIDTTFGDSGIVISSFRSQNFLNVIKLQPDGKILAAGQSYTDFCIARYNSDGSLDSAFGTNGATMIAATNGSAVYDMSILVNGNIIAVGSNSIPGSNYEIRMVRLTSDGLVDSTFGNQGIVSDTLIFPSTLVSAVLIQNDNKFVIGGRGKIDVGGNTEWQMCLARFSEDGIIDSTYGVNGIATYPMAEGVNDMSFDANGNIVATGEIGTNSLGTAGDISVMRFNPNGIPDSTFGTNGSEVISVDSYADYVNALLIQGDGKILVGGSYFNFGGGSGTDCLVIRFLENGTPDSTFGVNGVFMNGVSGGTDRILDMAFDSRNRIIYSGTANPSTNFDFIVGRLVMDLTTNDIGDLENLTDIIIFPNPVRDFLNVRSATSKIRSLEIFNLIGQPVFSRRNIFESEFQLDIAGLVEGIYFIRLECESGIIAKKFEVFN